MNKKPLTLPIPAGYRLLAPEEKVKAGDKYWLQCDHKFIDSLNKPGTCQSHNCRPYIRPVEAPLPTHKQRKQLEQFKARARLCAIWSEHLLSKVEALLLAAENTASEDYTHGIHAAFVVLRKSHKIMEDFAK